MTATADDDRAPRPDAGLRHEAALPRVRLQRLVLERPGTGVCTIIAPAGFGKSTFAAELVRAQGRPSTVIGAGAAAPVVGGLIRAVTERLAGGPGEGRVVVVDDAHLLTGTAAAEDLRQLVARRAPGTLILLVGRTPPPVDLHRERLEGTLVEIDANDLRFRTWEVEELFHRVYRVRFPPAEVAALAAATDGWVAGLQLYRHATQRSSDAGRRQQLELLRHSRLETVRSYLSANVLGTMDDDLRRFALDASVLGVMTPPLANRLLDRIDAARCLDRLVALQLFTTLGEDGGHRFHDVFRSFLESQLAAELPAAELEDRYRRAGLLLEEHGAVADAARAFAVVGSEADVRRTLAALGHVTHGPGQDATWFDAIPHGLLADHRVRLARARSLARAGRPAEALAEYAALAGDANSGSIGPVAAAERDRLRRWTEAAGQRLDPADWTSVVRASLTWRGPGALPGLVSDPALLPVVEGVAALLDGDPRAAVRELETVDHGSVERLASTAASACAALAWWMIDGLDPSDTLARLRDDADRDRLGWTTRIMRAVLLAFPLPQDPPVGELLAVLDEEAFRHRDPWTPALGRLALLLGSAGGTLRPQDAPAVAGQTADTAARLTALGADSLATWATLCGAAADDAPTPGPETLRAAAGGAGRLASLVRMAVEAAAASGSGSGSASGTGATPGDPAVEHQVELQVELQADPAAAADLPPLQRLVGSGSDPTPGPCRIRARLLGAFELTVDGRPVDVERLRPRARSVLRMLAMRAGTPVHRDVILTALWPDTDPAIAAKRLHVAISAIRHELGPAGRALSRSGESYLLGGGPHQVGSDLSDLDAAISGWEQARRAADHQRADHQRADDLARAVLALHSGELLTDEGSASWVVAERDHRLHALVGAATHLARRAEQVGDWDGVVRAATLGLRHDRYRDELWTLTITALERAERLAELERARSTYQAVLADLGVR